MSAIVIAFEYLHARKWLVELLLVAAIVAGLWILYDSRIDAAYQRGVVAQQRADDKATSDLREQVAQLTAENFALATTAKVLYDKEHASNVAGAAAPVDTRELCKPATHEGGANLPAVRRRDPGDAGGAATAGVGSAMRPADNGQSYDRPRLLAAIAAIFDDQSAVIRQYHGRRRRPQPSNN